MSNTAGKVEQQQGNGMNPALDIAAIRRRLQRATPGPWAVGYGPHGKIQNSWVHAPGHLVSRDEKAPDIHAGHRKIATVWNVTCTCIQGKQFDNQEFIANAITDIPLLIEEIHRLRRILAQHGNGQSGTED